MPLRNPFKKAQSGAPGFDASPRIETGAQTCAGSGVGDDNIERLKGTSAIGIKPSTEEEPNEFQMSVVNDSGVYLPPSPPEKKSFWHRSNASITSSSNHRSCLNENEPFSISRESFDSYRRSFDISARSPVILPDTPPRHSLESWSARAPRSLRSDPRSDLTSPTQEETFEEVKLADDPKPQKKRGIFGRFGDSSEAASGGSGGGHLGFHNLTGRKRGHSGQGAELGKMDRPGTAGSLKAVVGPTES